MLDGQSDIGRVIEGGLSLPFRVLVFVDRWLPLVRQRLTDESCEKTEVTASVLVFSLSKQCFMKWRFLGDCHDICINIT